LFTVKRYLKAFDLKFKVLKNASNFQEQVDIFQNPGRCQFWWRIQGKTLKVCLYRTRLELGGVRKGMV